MMFRNSSIEHVPHRKEPRDPPTNDQRLQQFRRRRAALCTTEFNTHFIAGRRPESERANAK